MSGCALVYVREGPLLQSGSFNPVMDAIRHRGVDTTEAVVGERCALGVHGFWTTPEDENQRQPLRYGDLLLGFDGRLDNRDDLSRELAGDGIRLEPDTPDANLVAQGYALRGDAWWSRLRGVFSILVYEAARDRVVAVRDQLGDNTLYYYRDEKVLIVASEEQAVLSHPAVRSTLDEGMLALFFAGGEPVDDRTFFSEVKELLPGHCLTVDRDGCRLSRFWNPPLHEEIRYRTDREYGEHFAALLGEAVQARARSRTPVGLQLSGGLDSGTLATVLATLRDRGSCRGALFTASWVFRELTECDESQYVDAINRRFALEHYPIPSDNDWAFKDLHDWPLNPNTPEEGPFRPALSRMYQVFRDRGARVMLTGLFGDHLFLGGQPRLLWDLLRCGRWGELRRNLAIQLQQRGLAPILKDQCKLVLPETVRRRMRRRTVLPWLTPACRDLLPWPATPPTLIEPVKRPLQQTRILGLREARNATLEIGRAHRERIEIRNPFRDSRLVEFMLRIPSFQLQSEGWSKAVMRTATKGLMPEAVRTRRDKGSFAALYSRGFHERESDALKSFLDRRDAAWTAYVDWNWVQSARGRRTTSLEGFVVSRCVLFELWLRRTGYV